MNRILLIGPPGAGKTVIATKISENYQIPFIKTGSLLRDLKSDNPNFNVINEAMKKGVLAPNNIIAQIVKEEVLKYPDGYVLDGWMRQLSDGDFFEPELDLVLFLNCPLNVCQERVLNRVVCLVHNTIYSFSDEVCHLCGGKLEKRSDDTEETFNNRWKVYETKTLPVIDYYREKKLLVEVDVNRDIPSIVEEIDKILKSK
ncbi:nucleoside monophosphate kinase [bacterium]|jgi:adenylate kinase|nr:nucleoside monophosphate kinase [bacterium]NBO35960.1 nucleoside monophosphate kinase [bacterium]